jgi:signal transduction histidine kinase
VARVVPWAVLAAVLSGVTVNVLRLRADVSLAGPSVAAQVLEITAAAALIVVGGAAGRGPARWLLPAAGAGWLVAEWASPAAPGAAAFTTGLIAVLASLPLVLASRWPRTPVAAGQRLLLALAVLLALAAAVTSGPLAAAAASPRDAGCTDCARDLIAVAHDVALNTAFARLGGQLAIAAGLAAVAWLVAGLAAARRRHALPSLSPDVTADVAAATFAAAVAAGAAVMLRGGPADPLAYPWHAAASGLLVVLAAAVAVPALRAARARRVVARAAVAVADDPGGTAADALSAALHDPGLCVAYPGPDGTWRDHHGQPVALPEQDVTLVADAGETVAALIHSSPVRIDPASVTGAVSAARILLDTERIEAGALARVSNLRTARQHVVQAADAARASLERDLHDGAQQRLVALRYALGLASAHAARRSEPVVAAGLAAADLAAERALADLRELAHGISPAGLAAEGLAGAVRTAVEHAPGAVTIVELPAERLPDRVEQAIYRLVADSVRQTAPAPAPGLAIAIRRSGQDVIVELDYDHPMTGQDWPATHLADRVAAAGGQLHQAANHGHQQLIAILPCE